MIDINEIKFGRLSTRYTLREVIGSLMGRGCDAVSPGAIPPHDPRTCKTCAATVLAEAVEVTATR